MLLVPLKFTLHMSFNFSIWAYNIISHGTVIKSMKTSMTSSCPRVEAMSHRLLRNAESSSFQFVGPKPMRLSNILWLVKNSHSLTTISLILLHFEHGHFMLAQTLKRSHEDW